MTQLHTLASLDGQRSYTLCLDLRNECADAHGDFCAILVELALPQHAGEHRAPQLLFCGEDACRCSLMSAKGYALVTRNQMAQLQNV